MALPVPFPSLELIQQKTNIGYMRNLWIPSSMDYKVFEDDFWGDLLKDFYPAAKTNGTSAAVTFTEHNKYGYLELVSGTDDNGYAGQGLGLQFDGDRGVLAEFIIKTPADITDFKVEFGLTDADDAAGAINAKATPTLTATDCAVFVYDTDDGTTPTGLSFITGNGGTAVAATALAAGVFAASTFYRAAVRVEGNSVSAWLNGVRVAGGTLSLEGGSALTPWVFCQARAGSESKTVQLHKWRAIMPAWA